MLILLAATILPACARHDTGAGDSTSATASPSPGSVGKSSQDSALSGPSSTSASSAGMSDENILAMAADGDRLEVAVAKLAASKASNPQVKAYAEQLIDDHTKGETEVRALAARLHLTEQPPAEDTTRQELQHLTDRFNGLSKGMAFDSAFVNHEVEDHQNDIKDAKDMQGKAQRPEVKQLLSKELPELQKHLARAQALSKSLAARK